MALTLAEIKDLIIFGQSVGLHQLQTEGLVCVYGPKPVEFGATQAPDTQDDTASILAHYSAVGREKLRGHSSR